MSNLEGKVIRGYRLDLTIGVGGFGTVYHAYQDVLNREVAVKVIKDKYVNDPQFVRQFETEARIVASLEHFNIVTLYDYWRDPNGAYLVMRWLRGGSLRSFIRHSPLTLVQTVRVVNQIASALAFSHQQNVIHRDIKPENILLDRDGNVFLTDFGIAVNLRDQEQDQVENISFGSPDYVAPELLKDRLITPKSDIYSMGIMLYELLAKRRPFVSKEAKDIIKMHLYNPIPSLKIERPDLPQELDLIIWKATAKKPENRYNHILELAREFQNMVAKVASIPSEYLLSSNHLYADAHPMGIDADDDLATEILPEFAQDQAVAHVPASVVEPSSTPPTLKLKNHAELDDPDTPPLFVTPPLAQPDADEASVTAQVGRQTANIVYRNPYKGLRAFEETDADTFFGRQHMIGQLLDEMQVDNSRFLALIGASGSGKSSLVRAGLMPALRQGALVGSKDWFYSTMTPTHDPFSALAEALQQVAIAVPPQWNQTLTRDEVGLYQLLPTMLPDDGSDLLLFIDQFEELFTLVDDEATRKRFLETLCFTLQQADSRLRLILTLRADFYDRPLQYPVFGQMLKDHSEVILPLTLAELTEAVSAPARHVGLVIDDQLTDVIIQQVHQEAGALPLLQYALTEMVERGNRHLTLADYQAIGGISGALAQRAQDIYAQLTPDEQRDAHQLFLRLVAVDEQGNATRNRLLWSDLLAGFEQPERLERVINAFSQHRLLTLDRDPITRTPTVAVAHETLLKQWGQLKRWIDDSRYALQKHHELQVEVERWQQAKRDRSYLASGARLAEFETVIQQPILQISDHERAYIMAAIDKREAEIHRTRRNNMVLSALSLFLLAAASFALWNFFAANRARNEAETQRDMAQNAQSEALILAQVARSRELAANAIANQQQNDLALLLATAAYQISPTYESVNSLLLSLQRQPFSQRYLYGHQSWVRTLTFDHTGNRAVSGGFDNSLIRWDLVSGQMIGNPLTGHQLPVNAVVVHPDNTLIASASIDQTVRLWDFETGEAIALLTGHESAVWGLQFSADGRLLASSDESGVIILWDVEQQTPLRQMQSPQAGIIYTLDFDERGEQLAAGGDDHTIRLWDVATGEALRTITGHANWVRTLRFDQRDQVIIAADEGGYLYFWDAATGEAVTDPIATPHQGAINDLALSYDGQLLATAGTDGVVHIWDLSRRGSIIAQLNAHQDAVWSVAFSPNDFRILSASRDDSLLLSELRVTQPPAERLLVQDAPVLYFHVDEASGQYITITDHSETNSIHVKGLNAATNDSPPSSQSLNMSIVAAAQTEQRLALSTADNEIVLWQIDDGTIRWRAEDHDAIVLALAFFDDGRRLLTADEAGVIMIWDVLSGERLATTLSSDQGVTTLAISPDEQYVALGGRDSLSLWSLPDETFVTHLDAHHEGAISALVFDHDSHYLYSGGRDQRIVQWDVQSGEMVRVLTGHRDWVLSFAISPDNKLLASGERGTGAVYLWDLASGRQIGAPLLGSSALNGWVTQVQFSDPRSLWSNSREAGVLIRWQLDPEQWVAHACRISNRTFTPTEWMQFFSNTVPYEICPTALAE